MKKDLGLIAIGMCLGFLVFSVLCFALTVVVPLPTPTPTITFTHTITNTPTITRTSTSTVTPILETWTPTLTNTPTITPTRTKRPTAVPTIKLIIPSTHKTPKPSASYPAGVTAICKDGTYSYSKTSSGTCSHHGGVKKWINKP